MVSHRIAVVWDDGSVDGIVGWGRNVDAAIGDAHSRVMQRASYNGRSFRIYQDWEVQLWRDSDRPRFDRVASDWDSSAPPSMLP